MPWIRLDSVHALNELVVDPGQTKKVADPHHSSRTLVVCYVTASSSCFLCKLVEPKVRPFADDAEYSDISFCSLDLDDVQDATLLPEEVSSLPTFLLYDTGELKDIVRVTREQRPGRLLARAIKKAFG
jgi:hypothetical protein